MKKSIVSIVLSAFMMFAMIGLTSCGDEPSAVTTLRIGGWNFSTESVNNLNRRMLKEFETANGVEVEIVDLGSDSETVLTNLAGNLDLPDVFMLPNIALGLRNEWLLDITDRAKADADWSKIPKPVEEAANFNGKIFAVPAEMHLAGYYVNDTTFENKNEDTLAINPTVAAFDKAVVSTKLNDPTNKVASLSNEASMLEWYPSAINNELGWFTWDGAKYNLDSDAFATTMTKLKSIRTNGQSFDSWTKAQQEGTGATDVVDLFRKNGLAMYYGYTYERHGIEFGEANSETSIFNGKLRYIGVPGGRNIIVPDMYGISSSTKQADLAYKLAKWMSFDPSGIAKRLELDTKREFVSLPMTTDETVVNAYFEKNTLDGLKEVFATIDNAVVESTKIIPGYVTSRWKLKTNQNYNYVDKDGATITRNNAELGELLDDNRLNYVDNWASIKTIINNAVNAEYQSSVKLLNELYPKA